MHDGFFGVKHLAHFNGCLGFLVRISQLPQMLGHGADADHRLDAQLGFHGAFQLEGNLLQILAGGGRGNLLNNGHIGFVDADDKILHIVGEQR